MLFLWSNISYKRNEIFQRVVKLLNLTLQNCVTLPVWFFSFEKKDVFQNQTKDVFLETRQRGIKPNKMFSFLGNPFCLLSNQKM